MFSFMVNMSLLLTSLCLYRLSIPTVYVRRSLAELAFSTKVGCPLKPALNSLLCALCNAHPPLFTLILNHCEEALSQGLPLQNFLQTLAQVSQSHVASDCLTESDFASNIVSQISSGFDWLLGFVSGADSAPGDNREKLEALENMRNVSMYLAFLTDFLRNWKPAKDWVGNESNRMIWPVIMAFLCANTSRISAVDITFLQDVVCEFFSACVHSHAANKALLVKLFCNSLRGHFEFEPASEEFDFSTTSENDFVLTPFLYKLLTELILHPESIPMILTISTKQVSPSSLAALTLSHDTDDFHPSFPVGSNCYYFQRSPQVTIDSILTLFTKQETKANKSAEVTQHYKRPPPPRSKLAPPPTTTEVKLNINSFNIKEYRLANPDAANLPAARIDLSPTDDLDVYFSGALKVASIIDICSESCIIPKLTMRDPDKSRSKQFETGADVSSYKDLLEHFVAQSGLQALALCLPLLYPYHWPQLSESEPTSKRSSQVLLDLPSSFPAHSVFMLGMCMRIGCYSNLIGENPPIVFVLLKLMLKAKVKGQY